MLTKDLNPTKKVVSIWVLGLRHTLHQRTLYFSEHFASQELNTLCSPTHFAKSQFTPQHPLHCYLLLKRTVCFKLACYSLLLNTLYPSAHFAYWNNFLLGTLCFQTLFASQNPFLLSTICFSTHFAPQPTLLVSPLCTLEHFATWNILVQMKW